ncbi:hypothetical protein [Halobacillus sp. H74]|uniref:hypothetical protein n=1 Tax=Halobacillus sp. H74 TaxID=3457436 RepID=UPI003FCCEBA8
MLDGGATFATTDLIDYTVSTDDTDTTGYQMKVFGDIDLDWAITNGYVASGSTSVDEASALWITYSASNQLRLSSGDGTKTVNLIIRDDVRNPSAQVSDTITLDQTRPIVTITGPDKDAISKQSGANVSNFSFSVNEDITEYKVKVVASSGASHDTGTQIPETNGSTNMSGTTTITSGTVIDCSIYGSDIEAASSGDGDKIVKVFALDDSGQWSI